MRKIENFRKESEALSEKQSIMIYGCKEIRSFSSETNNCCVIEKTDFHNDSNDNGVVDCDEVYCTTTTIECIEA